MLELVKNGLKVVASPPFFSRDASMDKATVQQQSTGRVFRSCYNVRVVYREYRHGPLLLSEVQR